MENIIAMYISTIILMVILTAELIILSQKINSKTDKHRKEVKKAVKN